MPSPRRAGREKIFPETDPISELLLVGKQLTPNTRPGPLPENLSSGSPWPFVPPRLVWVVGRMGGKGDLAHERFQRSTPLPPGVQQFSKF